MITSIPPKPSRAGDEVKKLLQEADIPTFDMGIGRLAAFQKAAMQGVPVYAVKDQRAERGWQDYKAIGNEILRLA